MAWYDFFKDAASAAQKAGNIELFQSLLSAQQQVFEIQAENFELRKKIEELQDTTLLEKRIIRYSSQPIIRLENDDDNIAYCSVCWDDRRKLIQLNFHQAVYYTNKFSTDAYQCHSCKNSFQLKTYLTHTNTTKEECRRDNYVHKLPLPKICSMIRPFATTTIGT